MADKLPVEKYRIPLYQVLEEEYVTLHGPLPHDYDLNNKDSIERLAAIYKLIHKLPEPRTAVCLSGGGIRSGTFSLGVLQGLARRGLLEKFHYLSTVSGGGYIGSWFTAWSYRHPNGMKGAIKELALKNLTSKFQPEPKPISNLRAYSNFLTPRFSLLSADVWTFIAIYLRNLILNWLVMIPLITAVLAIPRICISLVRNHPPEHWGVWTSILLWSSFVIGVVAGGLAIGYMGISRPTVSDAIPAGSKWRRRRYKDQESFLWRCLLPLSISAIFLTTFWAWHSAIYRPTAEEGAAFFSPLSSSPLGFMALGVIIYLIGWIRYSIVLGIRWRELGFVFVTGIVGGALLWIVASIAFPSNYDPIIRDLNAAYADKAFSPYPGTALYVCLASPAFLLTALLAITFFIGITSRQYGKPMVFEDEDREWLSRLGGWVLIIALVWTIFSLIVVFGPIAMQRMPTVIASLGGISGLLSILAGHSSKTPATDSEATKGGVKALIFDNIFTLAAIAFIVFLAASLSYVTSLSIDGILQVMLNGLPQWATKGLSPVSAWYGFDTAIPATPFGELHLYKIIHYTPIRYLAAWIGVLCAFGLLMAKVINLNKFSLHAGYSNRIIRAFLGASHAERDRKPNLFTGFDPTDNLQMHELRPGLLQLKSFKEGGLKSLALKLKEAGKVKADPGTNPSAYLWENLSDETKIMVSRYSDGEPSQSLKNDLIEDLNRILEKNCLYTVPAFGNLTVTERTNKLIGFLAAISDLPPVNEDQTVISLIEQMMGAEGQNSVPPSICGVYLIGLNRYLLDETYKEELADREFPLPAFKLMHVINTALNLVKGDDLAWQQRKAEAFSVSPLHCGSLNPRLGYRRARDYGGKRGISLGTAVAISGAAASSNMGYLSTSSAMTFVMTFFNARLGWWLGNPGRAGNKYFNQSCPNFSIYPIVAEAFGLTNDRNAYVLLSDGGHFENLALYEMVLRRCKLIVVVDGGQDEKAKFDDLGNAVRKIRIDFGIPIEFSEVSIFSRSEKKEGRYCAIGDIKYSAVDGEQAKPGTLIYIKPSFYGKDEPRDVYNYAVAHDAFPHDSTADQWFDEPQFESYRMLGAHVMDKICGEKDETLTFDQLIERARAHSKLQPDKASAAGN